MKLVLAILALSTSFLPQIAAQDASTGTAPASLASPSSTDMSAPLAPHTPYTILPGDVLDIHYRYSSNFDQTIAVQPDGNINLNVVGTIHAQGLTADQLHDVILRKASLRLNQPEILVSLKDFHRPSVVVGGEVTKPGKVDFAEGSTALSAILLCGGFGENARAGQVLVFRKSSNTMAEVHVLKLGHLSDGQNLQNDMKLQPGDMIMVPRDRIWKISRYVKLANVGFYFNPLDKLP